ncbi:glucosamine inositolphosphorylceramide transferase family protein [Hyphomicrobium facile]|uniref:Glucosamine inositolphosphorylceramide transferase 1 N-terminal domain-containing protein n=1 Tax=Hyphomicrobium facile TaxID=51670 RepID=A0A1I7N5M7_9HYPH|nr:hypothetical protein [Hyphomicrobium facile]SFV29958.1 hypothetical protein SAMN04488557_1375 [Hyphomicrobium facile]
MRICVVIGRSCAREWHNLLARRLVHDRHEVAIFISEVGTPLPSLIVTTLAFERLVYGIASKSLLTAILVDKSFDGIRRTDDVNESFDVVLRLDGDASAAPIGARSFHPLFNVHQSEVGAVHAILDGQDVMIGVGSSSESTHANEYAIETELPTIIGKTLNNACARMIDLLAWHSTLNPTLPTGSKSVGLCRRSNSPVLLRHAAATLTKRLLRRLDMLARGGDRWMIGWRHAANQPLEIDGGGASLTYRRVPDDGQRFLADPFPVVDGGRSWLFCEEYPYATGRGIISVIDLDDPAGVARPIIEESHHLSYPMVFADDGRWWMIPESGASNRIVLYRCEAFPFKWTYEATLIDVAASDPTLYRDETGYWLIFTSCEGAGSPSDRLCLYHAPTLYGPWRPCGQQPLAIDARTSRPAGHILNVGGALYRPAQDCSRLYGSGIVWCQFSLPLARPFEQVEIATLSPRDARSFRGAHTYNRSGSIEAIDVYGAPSDDAIDLAFLPVAKGKSNSLSGQAPALRTSQEAANVSV